MRSIPIIALLLATGLAGCSSGSDDWPGRDLENVSPAWRKAALAAWTGVEFDFPPMQQGDRLEYDWFVLEREPVQFNIHYHTSVGADKRAVERWAYEGTGPFIAPEAAPEYSLMWFNDSPEPLELWVQLEGEVCRGDQCATEICIYGYNPDDTCRGP